MTQVRFNFDSNITLTYNLVDSESARFFADSIQSLSVTDICPTSMKNGFMSETLIPERIARLYAVADKINLKHPGEVTVVPLEPDWRLALQQMHTHFPELTNRLTGEESRTLTPLLGEFNDLIHWLEKELNRKYNGSELDRSWATICLDFNRADRCQHRPIPDSDYQYFTHELYFGNLHLHYDNVGRHPWELFGSRDYICPSDQVISQTQISPSCNMYFNDWDLIRSGGRCASLSTYQNNFDRFYNARGGQAFFKYALDDPKLAVGYMKIGCLENVNDYTTIETRLALRNQLATSNILGWEIL